MERRVKEENVALQESKETEVLKVQLVLKGPEVCRVYQDHRVTSDQKAHRERRVSAALLAHLEFRATVELVFLDQREIWDFREDQVLQVHMA